MLDTGWRPKVLARINKIQDDLCLFLVVDDQETNSMGQYYAWGIRHDEIVYGDYRWKHCTELGVGDMVAESTDF